MSAAKCSLILILPVLFVAMLFSLPSFSDQSDADKLPDLAVYDTTTRTEYKGAILDHGELDCTTHSSSSGVTFILEAGSTIVSGRTYIMSTGDGAYSFRMIGSLVKDPNKETNRFLSETGLRILFYADPDCSGTPVFSCDMDVGETYTVTNNFENNTPYYIQVQVLRSATFDEKPNTKNIGFTFTIDAGSSVNAVYFDNGEGEIIDQKLMTNGQHYELPDDPVRAGYSFLGWYLEGSAGTRITGDSIVDLRGDTTLYARWWAYGPDHIVIITPSDDVIDMEIRDGSGGSKVIDINATDPDGNVLVDEKDVDLGRKIIPIDISPDHSGKDYLDVKTAQDIVEVYDSLKGWFEGNERTIAADVSITQKDRVRAEPEALDILSDKELVLVIIGDAMRIIMSSGPMHILSNYDDDIYIRVSECSWEDLDSTQKKMFGNRPVYSVSMYSGDTPIHSISSPITVEIDYTVSHGSEVSVYSIDEDGRMWNMGAVYSNGAVRFSTGILSVYCIVVSVDNDPLIQYGYVFLFLMIIGSAAVSASASISRNFQEVQP